MLRYGCFLWISLCFLLCSCHKEDKVIEQLNPSTTLLIYMDADNSLAANVEKNLKSIERGYSSVVDTNTHLLIYLDNRGESPLLFELSRGAGGIKRRTIESYNEQVSTDPEVMQRVMDRAFGLYTSEHYGLILWSHGKSWVPAMKYTSYESIELVQGLSYSWGSDEGEEMNIPDMERVLSRLPVHLDLILFDSCFMSSIEVAYELRNVADYIIASPIEILSLGFPYEYSIPSFFKYPLQPKKLAETYALFYNGHPKDIGDENVSMYGAISVIKTNELTALAEKVKEIVAKTGDAAYSIEANEVQRYYRNSASDFCYDFLDYYYQFSSDEDFVKLMGIVHQCLPYTYTTSRFFDLEIQHSCGLATYILEQYSTNYTWDAYYTNLAWSKATGLRKKQYSY